MKSNFIDIFLSNQRLSNWFLKLLIGLMLACAAVSIVQFGQRLSSTQDNPINIWYLPLLIFAISIEAFATREKVESLEFNQKVVYHIAEWIIFSVLLKVIFYLIIGPDQFWKDLAQWQQNSAYFFIGINGEYEYLPTLSILFLAWLLSTDVSHNLEELQSETSDFKWELGKLDNNRQAARQRITEKIFFVGGVMVLVSMATRMDLKQIWGDTPASQVSLANVLIYFLLALVFLSQTQFALMRGRWFWNQTSISPNIGKNWIKLSLIFFIIIALIAFILPTRYTFGFFQVIEVVFGFLVQIVFFIVSLLTIPCRWIFSLFGSKNAGSTENTPIQLPQLVIPQTTGTPLALWELIKSILFWAIFIGIVGFAFVHFLRENSSILSGVIKIPGLGWIVQALKSIWTWLKRTSSQITASISSGWKRIFPSVTQSLGRNMGQFFNFRQLSPRQQVIFYYLKLVERSKKTGVNRKPYQTPNQFAYDLEKVVPEVQNEVDDLTETFVEARYSLHPVSAEQTTAVQRLWRKIIKSLKPGKPAD